MSLLDTREKDIKHHLSKYPDKHSAVMPLLYIAQEEYGYITPEAIQEISSIIDMDETQIKGIIGFYTMYYDKPKGEYLLQICTDLPCALRGAEKFGQQVCDHLGVQPGGTTDDGIFTVEKVMCLAACDKAPMMQVNFHYYENLDIESVKDMLDGWRREIKASQPYSSGD